MFNINFSLKIYYKDKRAKHRNPETKEHSFGCRGALERNVTSRNFSRSSSHMTEHVATVAC